MKNKSRRTAITPLYELQTIGKMLTESIPYYGILGGALPIYAYNKIVFIYPALSADRSNAGGEQWGDSYDSPAPGLLWVSDRRIDAWHRIQYVSLAGKINKPLYRGRSQKMNDTIS